MTPAIRHIIKPIEAQITKYQNATWCKQVVRDWEIAVHADDANCPVCVKVYNHWRAVKDSLEI